jgi:D-proline reductase (dithiol) PrdB
MPDIIVQLNNKHYSVFSKPIFYKKMNETDPSKETFEEFKKSFSYGSRNDLNFKFLAGLSDEEAARFLQQLLWKLGDTLNDGQWKRIIDHVLDGQIQGYSGAPRYTYDHGPFVTPSKSISEAKLTLITSSGHFVDGDDPRQFGIDNMSQEEAVRRIDDFLKSEPTLSVIPKDTPSGELRVRHGGYDVRGPQADANVVFPLERLRELEQEGSFGELAEETHSFVGACSQTRLLKHTGPQWVGMLKQRAIDIALLVPV